MLNESGLPAEATREALDTLIGSGDAVPLPGAGLTGVPVIYSTDGLLAITGRLRETLAAFHRASSLRPGMAKEELRRRLGLAGRAFDQLLAYWDGIGVTKEAGTTVALTDHEPRAGPQQEAAARAFVEALRASPYSPPEASLDEDLLAYLEARGEIVRVAGGVAFDAEAYREMVDRVTATHPRQRVSHPGAGARYVRDEPKVRAGAAGAPGRGANHAAGRGCAGVAKGLSGGRDADRSDRCFVRQDDGRAALEPGGSAAGCSRFGAIRRQTRAKSPSSQATRIWLAMKMLL